MRPLAKGYSSSYSQCLKRNELLKLKKIDTLKRSWKFSNSNSENVYACVLQVVRFRKSDDLLLKTYLLTMHLNFSTAFTLWRQTTRADIVCVFIYICVYMCIYMYTMCIILWAFRVGSSVQKSRPEIESTSQVPSCHHSFVDSFFCCVSFVLNKAPSSHGGAHYPIHLCPV